eukprot:gene14039-29885_t
MNNLTEMYSIFKAEVPLDKSTEMNTALIRAVSKTDLLVVAGQLKSHCVKFTVRDILEIWGQRLRLRDGDEDEVLVNKKPSDMVWLNDGTSAVPGFEIEAESFVDKLRTMGVRITTTEEFSDDIRRNTT